MENITSDIYDVIAKGKVTSVFFLLEVEILFAFFFPYASLG